LFDLLVSVEAASFDALLFVSFQNLTFLIQPELVQPKLLIQLLVFL
jgi:hypothetical protein